ncbi:MAG: 30S ribosomal protein S2 [Calditrichia bacterium]|nr:30S ribosomal protein S2 [Calditrichota bacterium]MCB0268857.1 30S ribosomal protein S2 [Calditrichota bacterium]MCB0287632.1 30S ribosomal protein S2 [Calditrichota bacterium]MCB9069515.1 30S ribosomal protein S2 [Calditrichia bacterium]
MKATLEDLLKSGVHFGHLTRRWNPKMRPYIFMERNNIHIIDLKKTLEHLQTAYNAIKETVMNGEPVLFVGTKQQAQNIIVSEATRAGMPYMTERWLGGTLTNFSTIKKSIRKLENLEKMVSDGTADKLTKKERLMIDREIEKMKKVFAGIQEMKRLPGAIFVVDTKKEEIAVKEGRKLGIPIFAIVDTNCDPDEIDFPIPGNDDSTKAIGIITKTIADAAVDATAELEARRSAEKEDVKKD